MMQNEADLAFDTCAAALPMLQVSSGSVERSHLIGQELKPPRSRGRALDAENLAIRSYQKLCVQDAETLKRVVEDAVLKSRGLSRIEYHGLTSTFRFGKTRSTDAKPLSSQKRVDRTVKTKARTRKKDGWTLFRSEN